MRALARFFAPLAVAGVAGCQEGTLGIDTAAPPHTLTATSSQFIEFEWNGAPLARYAVYLSESPGVDRLSVREEQQASYRLVETIDGLTVDFACIRVASIVGDEESELSPEVCGRYARGPQAFDPAFTLDQGQAGAASGSAIAVGDPNGDGWLDVAVGSPLFDGLGIDGGRVALHLGRPNGLSTLPAWEFEGVAGQNMGAALAFGDYDGDGFDDLFVGAPGSAADAGEVGGFQGSPSNGLTPNPTWLYADGAPGARFGTAIAILPGLPAALFVGAPFDLGSGRVFSYEESIGLEYALTGDADGDEFGAAIAVGDLGGDPGDLDFAVGAPGAPNGAAYVFLAGGPGVALFGTDPGSRLGSALAIGTADTFGGPPALHVGAPLWGATDIGAIALYVMSNGALAHVGDFSWAGSLGNMGGAVVAGNVDGDEIPDIVYTADEGNIHVCEIRSTGPNCFFTGMPDGPSAVEVGALALADLTRDGRIDLLATAPDAAAQAEAVYLFAGTTQRGPEALPGSPIVVEEGDRIQPSLATFIPGNEDAWHRCEWDFGDGESPSIIDPCTPSNAGSITHDYEIPGSYVLRLRVTADGRTGEGATTVVVVPNP